jgi:hypothetical protein
MMSAIFHLFLKKLIFRFSTLTIKNKKMKHLDLEKHFSKIDNETNFRASLSSRGGYVTFSNSGRRGTKYFSLGIDSLIKCFEDILNNIDHFEKGQEYEGV